MEGRIPSGLSGLGHIDRLADLPFLYGGNGEGSHYPGPSPGPPKQLKKLKLSTAQFERPKDHDYRVRSKIKANNRCPDCDVLISPSARYCIEHWPEHKYIKGE